jgi:hypothetical protein
MTAGRQRGRGLQGLAVAQRLARQVRDERLYGLNGVQVAALLGRVLVLTEHERRLLWDARGELIQPKRDPDGAGRERALLRTAASFEALDAVDRQRRRRALDRAWLTVLLSPPYAGAAADAVLALIVADVISAEHFEVLTAPWRQVIGPTLEQENATPADRARARA